MHQYAPNAATSKSRFFPKGVNRNSFAEEGKRAARYISAKIFPKALSVAKTCIFDHSHSGDPSRGGATDAFPLDNFNLF